MINDRLCLTVKISLVFGPEQCADLTPASWLTADRTSSHGCLNFDTYSSAIGMFVQVNKTIHLSFQAVLVVNVASECGFTDGHYKALVKAKKVHGADGNFEILAFPCNQFGGQEPKVSCLT